MAGQSDEALVRMAQGGDRAAFSELVERYKVRIYRVIISMTKNHSDADDLNQETFLQAFRSLKRFKRESGFYTWIYRIAVNLTLNYLKKKSREIKSGVLEENIDPPPPSKRHEASSPERFSMGREFRYKLGNALDRLPASLRMAFLLVAQQEMSHSQASEILGCSENTVSWRMHKARKILQAELGAYLGGGKL